MTVFIFSSLLPKAALFLGLSIMNKETKKYFTDISSNLIEQR